MTVAAHIFCDVCGNAILEDRTLLRVESGPLYAQGRRSFDVCRDCLTPLSAVLTGRRDATLADVRSDLAARR